MMIKDIFGRLIKSETKPRRIATSVVLSGALIAGFGGLFLAREVSAQSKAEVAVTVAVLEGPTADRLGNVYFSDVTSKRIMKLAPDGVLSVFRESSNTSVGLVLDSQGRLLACEGGDAETPGAKTNPRITRTNLETGAIEVLADTSSVRTMVRPNDLAIDGKGRIYFTDMEGSAVYRIDAPNKVTRLLAAPDVKTPNGIQISPDDRTLYLVESGKDKSDRREIRAFDLSADGAISNPRTFYNFYPGRSGDGLSVDVKGNIYAAAGMNNLRGTSETLAVKAGVYVISPSGKLLNFIPIPQDTITNNTFGGAEMKTLYITAGATVYKIPMTMSGLPR